MIFIYNCYGGTHSSSLCSAIHLGKLPLDRVPNKDEILNTDYFDALTFKDRGRIIYRGDDKWGNKVYSVSRGSSKTMIPALKSLIDIFKKNFNITEDIVFINASPTVTFPMTVGGFISRALNIPYIGRPLLIIGVKQGYFNMVELVRTNLKSKGFLL